MELKIPHQHHLGKEPVVEAGKVVTPAIVVLATMKMIEKEPKTPKTMSSDPSLQRVSTRKKKEPTPEPSIEGETQFSLK